MEKYKLGFPNLEVQYSLSALFLATCSPSRLSHHLQEELIKGILEGRPELFEEPLKQFLASIPFDWYKFSKMDKYEGYWASLIYSVFATLGVQLRAEDTTNKGRIDLSLRHESHMFLIEFKMKPSTIDPIEQIKSKGYAQKYKEPNLEIWAVGMTFDESEGNITKFQTEKLI